VDLAWPFLGLTDEHGRDFGWCALVGPVRTESELDQLDRITRTRRLLGFTAYLGFPFQPPVSAPSARPEAWAHCFRSSENLPPAPNVFLPLSDFTDPLLVSPEKVGATQHHEYDFVYVCQAGSASEQVKGWELARRCLPILTGELGLRGLLVGRAEIADLDHLDRLDIVGELPWPELMRRFAASRFLFVPNGFDPSPRVIAEALLMGTPVLVNRNILGGWHQVNPFTGAFFESEADVASGALRCLTEWTSPRRWFTAHLGPLRSGARLAELLRRVDPQARSVRRVHLSYRVDDPIPAAAGPIPAAAG
jgi:glycosyltransferase involved in cell wall biosynthesis